VHVVCTMTVIAKKSMKTNHKIFFLIGAKNRSLLAAIYVGDNFAANRHQTLL